MLPVLCIRLELGFFAFREVSASFLYLEKLCDVERAVFCGGPGVAKVRVKFTNSLPLESIYSRLRDLKYCRPYYLFQH